MGVTKYTRVLLREGWATAATEVTPQQFDANLLAIETPLGAVCEFIGDMPRPLHGAAGGGIPADHALTGLLSSRGPVVVPVRSSDGVQRRVYLGVDQSEQT